MTDVTQANVANRLLRRLSEDVFAHLAPHLEVVDLPVKHSIARPNEPIEAVYFVESGLASVVSEGADRKKVEVRHVGYEGLTGHPVLLGVDRTPSHTFMQAAGHGLRIATRHFLPVLDDSETRLLFLRYVHTCQLQLEYSTLAAAKYTLHQRLARWLLMCQDRLSDEDLPLTHDFLSLMLGVRRSSVTDQLHILEGLQAIRSTRSLVHIRDRNALIEIAAGCYGLPEAEYERLMGHSRVARMKPSIMPQAGSQPQTVQP